MKKFFIISSTILICLLLTASGVNAAYDIHYDFESYSIAAGSLFTNDLETYSHLENLDGVELLDGLIVTSNASTLRAWNPSGNSATLFASDGTTRASGGLYYDINLSGLYTAVSFDIMAWDPVDTGPGTIEIFFSDNTSISIKYYQTGPTEQTPVFFGITSDTPLNRIRWNEGLEAFIGTNEETVLDNFTGVPEPCSLALLSLGGLMLRRRRRA